MPNYKHNKLIERIANLDKLPDDAAEYASWIKARGHLDLLQDNSTEDELIIYGSGDYTFINAVVASENSLSSLDQDDLLRWNGNASSSCASYVWGEKRKDVWIEREGCNWRSKTLKDARQLVFARSFEGWKGGRSYCEILQEYLHLTEIHWRSEEHAYCRFDKHGALEHVVSVTFKENRRDLTLVSFKRDPLEQYLAASNSVLVRMFEFVLLRRENFTRWPDEPENVLNKSDVFFYRQKVDPGKAAYTRGVQIIRPSRPKSEVFSSMKAVSGHDEGQYCEFVASDWRNNRITKISTDPAATTNYSQACENSLPFELSPAFFRPEVLSKYKADRDKYTIDEQGRTIRCRNAWSLESFDVNKADQIHAYICDLRNLPYQEQQYWLSFNEEPKANISRRASTHDFEGKWKEMTDPLQEILSIMKRWTESDLPWWKLREKALLERVSTPHTTIRDEWAGAFMDLSKLIIEGFLVKAIRARLKERDIAFDEKAESIALIEKFLNGQRLNGLREVQRIRSKMIAHSGGSNDLANDALQKHGTYSAHFKSVCETVTNELKLIEQAFS